ncbi:MAG: hypothetical protein HY711_03875 [Candidatus Melainabacteria bacterium]|nr:hypothetical protein [Candidatus Melainabacteria bacterium]
MSLEAVISSSASKSKQLWPLLVALLAVTCIASIISKELSAFEQEVLNRLMVAFGGEANLPETDLQTSTGGWSLRPETAFEVLLILGFSAASTLTGFRLSVVPRMVVTVQLFVLSILAEWGLWRWLHLRGHLIGYFAAVFVGCLAGYGLRVLELKYRKSESQYYELLLRSRELSEARLQLVKQDEVERRMLAADLHDQVLNDLKAIKQKFEAYTNTPDAEAAETIGKLLMQAMNEIREVMDSLCPSALEHLGLAAAIEDCLRRGSERAGFKPRFRSRLKGDELEALSMVEQSLLYRLVQESITNVCKHAQAKTVRATMEIDNTHLVISVADDGNGIDPAKLREDSRGVRYMRQRGDLIGATIAWRPGEQSKGTTVEIRMDLSGRKDGQSSSS